MKTANTIENDDATLRIGDIFTPIHWGIFAVNHFGIFQKWMKGATIFDPTMGQGHLLAALIYQGKKQGLKTTEMPILNLFGNELNNIHYSSALSFFKQQFDIDMSNNFSNLDILEIPPKKYDIILGNPPWQNFNDLPDCYKQKIKPFFEQLNLIGNKRDLLLGRSRIDIAALIIKQAIQNFLRKNGDAYFFMPLSLLLNDGAHETIRTYATHSTTFAPVEILDFNKERVFEKVATRYGLVHFKRDCQPFFPIQYKIFEENSWNLLKAAPLGSSTAALCVFPDNQNNEINSFSKIQIKKENTPRQGLNTCGANEVFFFKKCESTDPDSCLVNGKYRLPAQFVYPLLTASNFRDKNSTPRAWVLLPYNRNGRPLSKQETAVWPDLKNYLESVAIRLQKRKGTLINSWINKELWWALLGVGPYNFAPFKIVWEAYGRKQFRPMIFEGNMQANQALQAFIPCYSQKEANSILKKLQNPVIEKILLSYKMEGTMNWAQPGKIKKLIEFI
jgi:hypothetical protein